MRESSLPRLVERRIGGLEKTSHARYARAGVERRIGGLESFLHVKTGYIVVERRIGGLEMTFKSVGI